jgi:hypothetical protein
MITGLRIIIGGRVERLIETSASSLKQDISGTVNARLLDLVARNNHALFLSEDCLIENAPWSY